MGGGRGGRAIVFRGALSTRPRLLFTALGLLSPGMLWLVLLLAVPSFLMLGLAFATRGPFGEIIFWEPGADGQVVWQLTLQNFKKLAGYGIMGWSADYLWIFYRTLVMATLTTFFTIIVAYAMAFFIAARAPRWRYGWLILVTIPLCTNLVIRTYGWQLVLAPELPLARLAAWLHLIDEGMALHPSSFAMYLGMISSSLPFAVLPLYTNVERLDWSIVEAAKDLYASPWMTFRHAILPQTTPGLTVATILTFIPAMGVMVIPEMLGGGKNLLIGNLIQQQFMSARNYPLGAAISFGLILLTFLGLHLHRRLTRSDPSRGGNWL